MATDVCGLIDGRICPVGGGGRPSSSAAMASSVGAHRAPGLRMTIPYRHVRRSFLSMCGFLSGLTVRHLLLLSGRPAGTFYISNLGMFGIAHFDAILPPKVGAILSIGTAAFKPTTGAESGRLEYAKMLTATLTCDHRHIYGMQAAKFLQDLATLLNEPERLLVE
eukprot:GHVU01064772.1.p3 GENE.GHVU01064772.1~~GHVU01064772.1.p3  ORF type:complete len:165 (+),score=21.73 GHVU01064772.1:1200-1694(+)